MAIYHWSAKIINKKDKSIIAAAAYRSGQKLYDKELHKWYSFKKPEVVYTEIMLPDNAPDKYKDRQTLWSSVAAAEKQINAQYARDINIAIPNELPRDLQIKCIRDYVYNNFVSKGMVADIAIHDKNDGNPHAHILLTLRKIKKDGSFDSKQKTVYANDLDASGNPIFNPLKPSFDCSNKKETSKYRIPLYDKNGKQKVRIRNGKITEKMYARITIPSNNWNQKENIEIWRKNWADECNKYLSENNKIDHRSYVRQGIDKLPTIHEGNSNRILENVKDKERCSINRDIIDYNNLKEQIKQLRTEIEKILLERFKVIANEYRRIKQFIRYNTSGRKYDDINERNDKENRIL